MYYSSSDSEETSSSDDVATKNREQEMLFMDPKGKGEKHQPVSPSSTFPDSAPFGDYSMPGSAESPLPKRPSSARDIARQKALEKEKQRRAKRMGGAGMSVEVHTDYVPNSPSAQSHSKGVTLVTAFEEKDEEIEEYTAQAIPRKKHHRSKQKSKSKKEMTETEKTLLAKGISSHYDPSLDSDSSDEDEVPPERQISSQSKFASPSLPRSKEPKKSSSTPLPPQIDFGDIHSFLFKPPPQGPMIQCRIERRKGADKMHHQFCLFLEEGSRFLLAARKRKKSKTSNYLISLDRDDTSRHSGNYIGKVRSNFLGTEFTFYDKGDKPRSAGDSNSRAVRTQQGAMLYSSNVLGFKGPRKMRALIPALREDDTQVIWRPVNKEETLAEQFNKGKIKNMYVLFNKSPVWNPANKSYVLNFHNRVKQASVKNFQLVGQDDEEDIIMQFGRVSGGIFSMDFRWPMSLFQAFGIALTAFDNKIACE